MALMKTKVRVGVPTHELTDGTVTNSLTAAGTTQADALALTADVNILTTTGSGAGAILPNYDVGDEVWVVNGGANALLLYPPVDHYINDLAKDAAYSLAADKAAVCKRVSATRWVLVAA